MTAELTILTCTLCGLEVYSATPATYSERAIREAIDTHDRGCPARARTTMEAAEQ